MSKLDLIYFSLAQLLKEESFSVGLRFCDIPASLENMIYKQYL